MDLEEGELDDTDQDEHEYYLKDDKTGSKRYDPVIDNIRRKSSASHVLSEDDRWQGEGNKQNTRRNDRSTSKRSLSSRG
jgi:hypothetical protein